MKILKASVFVFVLFLISFKSLTAENTISIADTLIPRGDIYSIPVTGNLDFTGEVTIEFVFDAYNLDVKEIIVDNSTTMQCSPVEYSVNLDLLDSAILSVTCDYNTTNNSGTLFYIAIEGLAGPDSLTQFTPTSLLEGNSEINFSSGSANITVPGIYIQQPVDNLGNNFPNPFSLETRFPFGLRTDSRVEFRLYSSDGSLASGSDAGYKLFRLFRTTDGNFDEIFDFNQVLTTGTYELLFTPDHSFAKGAYYFVMITDRQVFNKSILYIK